MPLAHAEDQVVEIADEITFDAATALVGSHDANPRCDVDPTICPGAFAKF